MKTPWHLWVIGVLMLLWNGMGAMDYVMTVSRNPDYLAQFTPERLAFLDAFPTWAKATWALAVWLYVLGSLFILLRSRYAVWMLQAGFFFMIVTTIHNLFLAEVPAQETMSGFEIGFTIVLFILSIAQILYARYLRGQQILR